MTPSASVTLRLYDMIMLQRINALECFAESLEVVLYNRFDT